MGLCPLGMAFDIPDPTLDLPKMIPKGNDYDGTREASKTFTSSKYFVEVEGQRLS